MHSTTVALTERLRYLGQGILTVFNIYCCTYLAAMALSVVSSHRLLLATVPLLVATVVVTALTGMFIGRFSWQRIGLGPGARSGVPAGLALGLAACGALVLIAAASGLGRWEPIDAGALRFDFRAAPAAGVGLLIVGATAEELFARGLVLQCLARALGPAGAVLLTSVGFAAGHWANPGIDWLAASNTALFGIVFGVAVFRQRSLWLATGLHLGWNLALGVLGVNVSGITMRLTELNLRLSEPRWVTGGEYGFEGGLLATGAALVLLAVVWRLPRPESAGPMLWDAPGAVPAGPGGIDRPAGAGPGGSAGEGEDREAEPRAAG